MYIALEVGRLGFIVSGGCASLAHNILDADDIVRRFMLIRVEGKALKMRGSREGVRVTIAAGEAVRGETA